VVKILQINIVLIHLDVKDWTKNRVFVLKICYKLLKNLAG
jgi:hypothetical protein